ncbi:polysaccharide deacetylase [Citromicrobium sp. RCC1885]|uniref:XrtA system polysaccharide deacetylase n=1 Tax=unclassified Citromicrobium TaxID=2630544 RepID=UPI0006C936A6|nr:MULTISPECIES: XrtA system polysaccharide deacetylase [unclassified Citromicrobium]KPM25319.1 polysaccharide deacetylase [Citromicrobium sp. RCC1885]KPM28560.1 polysaccharide deacetylase [Citromicrobium sp. RCC1878]MAO05355.1 polysaccharide deacetylase family protein [Citromicrobium sp.]OAM09900.1 polysaccharide deacetylase [Citromicrobium sp. RCC1897]|tara:strand:+ start:3180 stop:4073 length:894 start_codon:yes stop_codon:yes gene_type:complete
MDLAPARHPQPAPDRIVNGLSVDVEDWFQVGAFENTIARPEWDGCELRVERNVARVLALFDRAGVKATFFTLGWVAERVPHAIRAIADAGHEVASHGYDHQRVFTFSREEFAEDLRKSRAILEDTSGMKVTGYRAPSFSIDARNPWAHEELAAQGYTYSSSVAPIAHDHYGWRDAPRFAFRPVAGAAMIELPVTTAMLGTRRLAAGGGGFFRTLPYGFSRWAIAQVNREDARPAVFYFHPWEVDPGQPRVADAPLRSRLRHYTNLTRMEAKLERLLRDFAWGRVDEVVQLESAREAA